MQHPLSGSGDIYLFEPGDLLNSPYEAFLFDTAMHNFPVRSHWHHYVEIVMMVEGTALIESDRKKYLLHPGQYAAHLKGTRIYAHLRDIPSVQQLH